MTGIKRWRLPVATLVVGLVLTYLAVDARRAESATDTQARMQQDADQLARGIRNRVTAAIAVNAGVAAHWQSSDPSDRDAATRRYARLVLASSRHDGVMALGVAHAVPPPGAIDWLETKPEAPSVLALGGAALDGRPQARRLLDRAWDLGQPVVLRMVRRPEGIGEVKAILTPLRPAPSDGDGPRPTRPFAVAIVGLDALVSEVLGPSYTRAYGVEITDVAEPGAPAVFHAALDKTDGEGAASRVDIAGRHWRIGLHPRVDAALVPEARATQRWLLMAGVLGSILAAWGVDAVRRGFRGRQAQHVLSDQLDLAFRHHPHAVYVLDRERRFVSVNDKAIEEFGVPRAALIGRSSGDLISPEHREIADRYWEAALRGEAANYDTVAIGPDGQRFSVRLVLVPIREGTTVTRVLGVAENITDRQRRDEELRQSRAMLQSVIDHLPVVVFWKDPALRYQGCNQAFAQSIGRSVEEIVGHRDDELIDPADAAIYREEDQRLLDGGGDIIGAIVELPRREGAARFVRTSKVALRREDGSLAGILGIAEDFTERATMVRELEQRAWHDTLTGLPNRARMDEHLARLAARAARGNGSFAVLYFDVDRFKLINDTHGHDAGDAVIKAVASRAKAALRSVDVVARLGGDEFVAVLEDVNSPADLLRIGEALQAAIARPIRLDGDAHVEVGTSVGGALHVAGRDPAEVVREADAAMYLAKRSGRGRVVITEET